MKTRIAALGLALWPSIASALVPEASANDTVDDARIELYVDSSVITGDTRSRCRIHLDVSQDSVGFSDNDHVYVWFYEDDLASDDLLWSTDFAVHPADLDGAGHLVRDFDCTSDFGTDGVGTLEVYASARVEKDNCGFACVYDRPSAGNINLGEVEDDGNEEDDASAQAHGLALGMNRDRIARDQDWQSVDLQSRSRLSIRALHHPEAGALDIALLNAAQQQIAQGVDDVGATVLTFEPAEAGTWYFRVSPRQGNDFNFYDLDFSVSTLAGDCAAGQMDTQACGNCGTHTRSCDANGNWLDFGACGGEGACAPASTRNSPCGQCGTTQDTCSDVCAWTAGACADEGPCQPGAEDEEACATGGTHVRTCGADCHWGDYGECGGAECQDGAQQACYTGPAPTRGVGACREGSQHCVSGRWGSCEGQTVPAIENCSDGLDNDCDGLEDDVDNNCDGQPQIGDSCTTDANCGINAVCLQPASNPQFPDGYCGVVPCQEDCGDSSACVSLYGRMYCLRACNADGDCRAGYRCLAVQAGAKVCAPPCEGDEDCTDVRSPVCDLASGLCKARGAATPDMGSSPPTQPPPGSVDAGVQTYVDSGAILPPGQILDGGTGGSGKPRSASAGCAMVAPGGCVGALVLVGLPVLGLVRRRRTTRR